MLNRLFGRRRTSEEDVLDALADLNKDIINDAGLVLNENRALAQMRDIRATLSGLYGISNDAISNVVAGEAAFHAETIRAVAQNDAQAQKQMWGRAVDSTILAAQRLAEDTVQLEGDVFAAVVAPIELGMDSRVWVSGDDKGLVAEFNGLLNAWGVMDTINAAWQDMETYSAFYITHKWDGVPTPIHWSPKHVAVGPDTGYGPWQFTWLGPKTGDELQTEIDFSRTGGGGEWNDWAASQGGQPLNMDDLTWVHFMKPPHKMYPYPWLAKAATPVYTRQVIEEMRLALVQGLINQLWVMTIEDPQPREITKLKSVISANRAERIGFLLWRAGLNVDIYSPQAIEQLLLPEAWWAATLDIFRRIGRTIRIVSGESATRSGQGSTDAEIDTRVAQKKAMTHRHVVAKAVVTDLARQWPDGGSTMKKMLERGALEVHCTPIEFFLGEDLKNIWGPMWNLGMASVRTIHAATGLDHDYEKERMKEEREEGLDELFVARQQFAQRVATPGGEVTKSPEPGRPTDAQRAQAATNEELAGQLLDKYDDIEGEDDVRAFIILLTTLLRAHMREAYSLGYNAVNGMGSPSVKGINEAIEWELGYIDGLRDDMLLAVGEGAPLTGLRFRIDQHVQASWRHAYMSGVFQAKREDGWQYWQRVLRPYASKSGPCSICREDAKRWHPISEPFWDHPYGVCSAQVVRFMRTGTDDQGAGWESHDRQQVPVPLWRSGE